MTSASSEPTLVLDAGCLVAVARADRRVGLRLERARRAGAPIVVPATVWAQVWRGGPRQVLLARLRGALARPLVPFTAQDGAAVGALLAVSGTRDVVDAHVVIVARRAARAVVLTSDPRDLRRLDPDLDLVVV